METTPELTALGYIGVRSARLEDWGTYATRLLGMQAVDRAGAVRAFRMDDRKQRLIVTGDEGEGLGFLGWEVANAAALDALAARLEAHGVEVRRAPRSLADERHVADLILFQDPAGNRLEVFHGPAVASDPFRPGRPIAEALSCLARRAGREFGLVPAAATSATPARTLRERTGSCRDVAHVLIAGLRGLGLPARAVTGYAPLDGEPAAARLHAWTGCWLGAGLGWLDLDPWAGDTGERVCLGWGRDHDEIAPARGVLAGDAAASIKDRVDWERVGPGIEP